MSDHTCSVAACSSPAKAGQLMCLPCWKRTPPILQMAINKSWRAFQNQKVDTRLARLKAYRAARDAAVQWHADNPPSPTRRRAREPYPIERLI